MYEALKALHLLGVILLVGNVTVSAVWKVFADRTGNGKLARFAQQMITLTDWTITLAGILLITGAGYGMAHIRQMPLFDPNWLLLGQILFAISGSIWLVILIPAQIRLARQAKSLGDNEDLPSAFRRDSRLWLFWGVLATVPLIAAIYVMIAKPT